MAVQPLTWCVFLCHPIFHADVKSLESGHNSQAQDPCLASVQEDELHDGLVELGTHPWRQILPSQHLSNPCPRPVCLGELDLHGLDVLVIL